MGNCGCGLRVHLRLSEVCLRFSGVLVEIGDGCFFCGVGVMVDGSLVDLGEECYM